MIAIIRYSTKSPTNESFLRAMVAVKYTLMARLTKMRRLREER